METLPPEPDPQSHRLYVPRPLSWPCDGCGQPSDIWEWGVPWTEDEDPDAPLPPVLCTTCQVDLVAPERRDAYRWTLAQCQLYVRPRVGLPGGTLIISREDFGSRDPRREGRFPGLLFGAATKTWDPSRPHDWISLDGDLAFVVLGGFVHAGWDKSRDIPAGWMIYRPWTPPDEELYRREIYPADYYPSAEQSQAFNAAAAAFFALPDPRGRWRGSGGYLKTVEALEAAVDDVVCALITKRRNPGYRPSYKEIGREIDRTHRLAGKPLLRDPGRSFTDLCARRGLNPKALVDHAVAACTSGARVRAGHRK